MSPNDLAYVSRPWKFFGWKKERARERDKRISLARNFLFFALYFQAPATQTTNDF